MRVGVPTEVKDNEHRVGMVPATAANAVGGKITYRAVAEAFDLPYTPVQKAL